MQISRNLRAISQGELGLDPLPDALLHVEEVADALATEEVGKKAAALLYGYLLEVPDEYWARQDDELDPQDHKEEIAARLEVVSTAARGSGCLGSLVALMALLGVGLGLPITLAFWLAI
jgi:hypothetical protein